VQPFITLAVAVEVHRMQPMELLVAVMVVVALVVNIILVMALVEHPVLMPRVERRTQVVVAVEQDVARLPTQEVLVVQEL
jgi:hypothetical protein